MSASDFSVFRERLAEACRERNMTHEELCSSVGFGGRRTIDILYSGLKALDIDRLAKVADRLDVSVDWLLGRTNVMSVMEMPELAESPKGKAKKKPHG
jgi:transcriptional regulator with XRE-family HTH domain